MKYKTTEERIAARKAYLKKYAASPERKAAKKKWYDDPKNKDKIKASQKKYAASPEGKAYLKKYRGKKNDEYK